MSEFWHRIITVHGFWAVFSFIIPESPLLDVALWHQRKTTENSYMLPKDPYYAKKIPAKNGFRYPAQFVYINNIYGLVIISLSLCLSVCVCVCLSLSLCVCVCVWHGKNLIRFLWLEHGTCLLTQWYIQTSHVFSWTKLIYCHYIHRCLDKSISLTIVMYPIILLFMGTCFLKTSKSDSPQLTQQ